MHNTCIYPSGPPLPQHPLHVLSFTFNLEEGRLLVYSYISKNKKQSWKEWLLGTLFCVTLVDHPDCLQVRDMDRHLQRAIQSSHGF